MQNYAVVLFSDRKKIILFMFILALIVRLLLILTNHTKNKFIDLNIYRETGQLVGRGVNPYKYTDGTEIRNKLRLDNIAYDSYVSGTQESWDFYTSSNLPLSSLFYGLIDRVSNSNPIVFRITFSFFDAILSAFIAFILIKYWQLRHTYLNLILVTGIAALSPALLLWGSIIPEDKGLQILFMLSGVYFAKDKKWILSALLLGCSVAYKGLGVFVYPISLYFVMDEPKHILKITLPQVNKGLVYSLTSIAAAVIWFIPYMPDVLNMMQNRLMSNLGADVEPGHGSIWTIVYNACPIYWVLIRNTFIITVSLIWSYVFIIRKINITAISLFLLVLFVDVMLLQGSMDRMNIGIIVSMVLFCFVDLRFSKTLAWYTIIAGWCFYLNLVIKGGMNQKTDAIFATGYLLLFTLYPLYFLFKRKLPVIKTGPSDHSLPDKIDPHQPIESVM